MTKGAPDLTVVVVTHQGREKALLALRTARAATGGIDVQWLVVDSGSTDGTPEAIAAEFPDVPLERRPNIGFAAGNNIALARATGRWVLLLNPDMEIARGSLADLVAALDERPRLGAGSVIQQWPDGGLQPTIRRFASPARQLGEALWLDRLPGLRRLQEEVRDESLYERDVAADWLVGGFLVVRREVIDEVGGLDERFFLFSEEADWCLRIKAAGWEVRHLPVMRVNHHTGRSSRADLFAQNSFSKLLYARKHFSPVGVGVFRAALVVRHLTRWLLFGARARRDAELRDRAGAERRALRVVAGVEPPPFEPYAGG